MYPFYGPGWSRSQTVFARTFYTSVHSSSQDDQKKTGEATKNLKKKEDDDKYSDALYPNDKNDFRYWEKDRRPEVYEDTEQIKHHREQAYVDLVGDQVEEGIREYKTDIGDPGLSDELTHIDNSGKINMIDISSKDDTNRVAVAIATVKLGEKAFNLVRYNKAKKGDVLTVAQIAGITAGKRTSDLIPLCHNIPLSKVSVDLDLNKDSYSVVITSLAKSHGKTGVEMEAIMAATIAAVTVYDMCKAVSREIVISDIKLLKKTGGSRGDYHL